MKRIVYFLLFILAVSPVYSYNVQAEEYDYSAIATVVNQYIKDKQIPGASVLVGNDNEILYEQQFGYREEYDMGKKIENPQLIDKNTLFDIASLTKVMATTQAIMKLDFEGKIDINDKVTDYLDEFGKNGKEDITIKDLLTHTSGLTPWDSSYFEVSNHEQMRQFISNLSLDYETGTDRMYSDFSFITLGLVIEQITGQRLDKYVEENIYQPLGMNNTMYRPLDKFSSEEINVAATSWGNPFEHRMVEDDDFGYVIDRDVNDFKDWRDYTLVGEVNDGNAFHAMEGVSGHAGLFSTAEDLSKLIQLILNGGSLNGVKLYDQEIVDKYTSIQSKFGHGLGWEINRGGTDEGYMGKNATESFIGHTGFTGTAVVFDKDTKKFVIILTNKQNLGVDKETNYPNSFNLYRDITNIVFSN